MGPAYLAGLYEVPLLTREQEVHLFRKMNYLWTSGSGRLSLAVMASLAARSRLR